MKSKIDLILSIILVVFGALGIFSFAVLLTGNEDIKELIPALILSICLVVFNLIHIFRTYK